MAAHKYLNFVSMDDNLLMLCFLTLILGLKVSISGIYFPVTVVHRILAVLRSYYVECDSKIRFVAGWKNPYGVSINRDSVLFDLHLCSVVWWRSVTPGSRIWSTAIVLCVCHHFVSRTHRMSRYSSLSCVLRNCPSVQNPFINKMLMIIID